MATLESKLAAEELRVLFEISQRLDKSGRLELAIRPALDMLGAYFKSARVALSLYDHESKQIVMQDSHGLSEKEIQKGRYEIGEGITGKVYETGEPEVVKNIHEDPNFLGRTISKGLPPEAEFSFLCVPIKLENEVIGALSVLRRHATTLELEANVQLLSIVASLIAKAVDFRRIIQREVEEKERLRGQLKERFRPANIIGQSKKMLEVFNQISQVSQSAATVLLLGESGVGKELVAHAIHYNSERSAGPFIRVNCAALPESILESELFGHEKGAFTGALKQRKGRFEQAQGGTLFLDEIGDFPATTQVALLRFLQEREIERVGGDQTIKLNVRIIAATNRDLENQMLDGEFRQDLYYRLNVFPIRIPALRERKEDIPLLVDYFIRKYRSDRNDIRRISNSAINALMTYNWPGNVRELENFIERAVLVSRDQVIRGGDLPPTLATGSTSGTQSTGALQAALDNLEREMISDALIETRGNMASAARVLGITERIMGLRVQKYGFNPKDLKK